MTDESRVYLAGMMGAGKSSVARRIGAWTGWPCLDVDSEVERAAGMTVAELWSSKGESAFREAERTALETLTEQSGPAVLALGGGTLEDSDSRARLRAWGTGIYLEADADILVKRVRRGGRPLIDDSDPGARLAELMAHREPRYRSLQHAVATGERSIAATAVDVLRVVGCGSMTDLGDGIVMGRGALASVGAVVRGACPKLPAGSVTVVTDDIVWSLHGAAMADGLTADRVEAAACPVASGDAGKRPEALVAVWNAMARNHADRETPLIALGGGAVGDLAGLAAATYKRGVPLVLCPTTLLAQVDAAIGGKNAINLAGVKNLIGTFHFPLRVVIDPLCLMTLPDREYRAGWAEVVKAGLIGDPELFDLCEARAEDLRSRRLHVVEQAVRRAVRVKTGVVRDDPREAGRRRTLNLGHTLGHALEAHADGGIEHGEAVAIGIARITCWAEREGIAESGLGKRVVDTLAGLGLPVDVPRGVEAGDLIVRLRHDKKRSGDVLHLVVPETVGRVRTHALAVNDLERWVDAVWR